MKVGKDVIRVNAEEHCEEDQRGQRSYFTSIQFEFEPDKRWIHLAHDHAVVEPDHISRPQGDAPHRHRTKPGLGLEGAADDKKLPYK